MWLSPVLISAHIHARPNSILFSKILRIKMSGGWSPQKSGCGFREKSLAPTPSVAKDLMPRDIMSSEPRQWMVQVYLASWSCLCSPVPRHSGGGCLSTALHRHNQLAKDHPVPWPRRPNLSWYEHLPRTFCRERFALNMLP